MENMKHRKKARMNKRFSFLFVIVTIFSLFWLWLLVNSMAQSTLKELKARLSLKELKTFKQGKNLGIVVMAYSNITDTEAMKVGYKSYEFYKNTGKTDKIIRIWILNISDKIIEVNPIQFKVVTEKGYSVSMSKYTFRTKNPFPTTRLEPKTKTEGFVVFGIEMGDNPVKVIYDDRMGNRVSREYGDALMLKMYEDGIIKKQENRWWTRLEKRGF